MFHVSCIFLFDNNILNIGQMQSFYLLETRKYFHQGIWAMTFIFPSVNIPDTFYTQPQIHTDTHTHRFCPLMRKIIALQWGNSCAGYFFPVDSDTTNYPMHWTLIYLTSGIFMNAHVYPVLSHHKQTLMDFHSVPMGPWEWVSARQAGPSLLFLTGRWEELSSWMGHPCLLPTRVEASPWSSLVRMLLPTWLGPTYYRC